MNHEKAYEWLHGDHVEYSGCRAAAETMQAEIDRLRARVAELEAARGEPGVWIRDQRGVYEGPETLDPMYYLGATDPGRGTHGAAYSPFYPSPPSQARGEPVAWMLKTGHGTAFVTVKPECEIDFWVPLFALKDK